MHFVSVTNSTICPKKQNVALGGDVPDNISRPPEFFVFLSGFPGIMTMTGEVRCVNRDLASEASRDEESVMCT